MPKFDIYPFVSGGYRGGREQRGGYDRGGSSRGQYGRFDNDRTSGGNDRGGGYGRDQPGSHANFGMRRDRRDSDRKPPPPQEDLREPTAGKRKTGLELVS